MTGPSAPPEQGFLRRLTLTTAWGEGLDGYDLGILSVTLPLIGAGMGLSPLWAGLIGASSLIGIFLGSPIVGYLTDRFGRRTLFLVDIAAFVVLGVLQALVTEPWQLFVVRLLLGVAIGAEYAIGAAMLAEFAPSRGRGRRLSKLLVYWYFGYLAAVVAAYALMDLAGWSWRWVLLTGALPALVVLVLRYGLPESPRWLVQQGRAAEARAIIERHLGDDTLFRAEQYESERSGGGWTRLFAPELRLRTVFVCTFWACLVAPYFAIFTFAPQVFEALGLADTRASTIAANAIAAIGAVVGMLTIERVGRRKQLIGPFWIMAAALVVVGLWSGAPAIVVVLCFAFFSFFNALSGNLTAVYPIEVFPTSVRSSGVGVASAFSRIGAAVGTFLLPVGISTIGIGGSMMIGAALCVVGAVVSQALAPETTGQTLTRTSAPV
ncbi:MFS transporter [Pseudonocardia sp. TRM90224]|uniref:MFS transporter n=1 Tax=Pseudonocardia sp. TRM90224 TaxID=2812678 RepID=UPI001E42EB9C|nr:MFS transporter [Pseudonocardia sp. TRM90224]